MGDEGEFSQSILDILYATEVLCEECSNDDVSTDGDIVAIVGNELSPQSFILWGSTVSAGQSEHKY